MNYTYIVECGDGSYYCGWTNDIEKRLFDHNQGKGAKYTKGRGPVKLVHLETYETKEQAMSREWHIKQLSRQEKEALIKEGNLSVRQIEYTVLPDEDGLSAHDIMKDKLKLSTREIVRCKQFDDGVMLIDGGKKKPRPIRVIDKLHENDLLRIKIYEDNDNSAEVVPMDGPLEVIYEDEDMILINKPGDVVVHPSHGHFTDSLSNLLAGYYKKTGQKHVMRVIGRLDRETSGLIIFAKNRHSAAVLSDQTRNMSRRKEYLALCSGVFENAEGTVDAPIGRRPEVRMIREVREDGKEAVTHYKVEKQFEDYALVRLKLDTGRTHQIRVHMKYIGHPLLGDCLYGEDIADHHEMKRAALHAAHLEFLQPITGQELKFEASLPDDMKSLAERPF